MGRGFATEDDRPGAVAVAILQNSVWQSRYGGDPGILGRSMLMNGAPVTVVGVMPDRSGFPSTAEVWLPLRQAPGLTTEKRDGRNLRVLGRVRDGVAMDEARVEIETIVDRLSRDYPATNRNVRARVAPINERFLGRLTDPGWLAFIAAGFLIVIISCANVANLMLAWSIGRARELAIRTSLGATRRRLVWQLLIEGTLLAIMGGAFGMGVSLAGVRLFRSAIPENALPYWMDYSVDWRVMLALASVSIATVFAFALLPAFRASKTDVNRVLKDGGRPGASDRGSRRWTTAFLSAEFALAVVLLAQVVVSFRAAGPPLPSDRALDTRKVTTAAVTLPAATYATPGQRIDAYRRLDERVRTIPGVSSASVATVLPLMGGAESRVDVTSSQRAGGGAQGAVRTVAIGSRYFETLNLPLIRGREFDDQDGTPGHAHAIVNERLASQFFADQDPIGKQITVTTGDAAASSQPLTIVGVAANVRQRPVPDPDPLVYLPYQAAPAANMMLLVRSDADPMALVPLLRTQVLALDAGLPVFRIQTMADVSRNAQWTSRLSHRLVLFITFIAVALSTAGLYAVTAYGVRQRTQEIGVRMALGAQPRQVVFGIVRRVLVQLAFGFLAGIAGTIAWQRAFSSGRVDLTVTEPRSLAAIAATLAVAAFIACFVPARRATRLDPVAAIRGD
jgi:putative ABC transport system permease protein